MRKLVLHQAPTPAKIAELAYDMAINVAVDCEGTAADAVAAMRYRRKAQLAALRASIVNPSQPSIGKEEP